MGLALQQDKETKDMKTVAAEIRGAPPIDADKLANPDTLKPYSEEEKKLLQKVYTPDQIASIEAGEEAIDPKDLADQAVMREDTMGLRYFDDLSTIHPVVDKPIRAPEENYDTNMRFKSEDELLDDYVKFFENSSEEPSMLEWQKFQDNQRLTMGKEEAERNPRSSLAPELPRMESLAKTVVSEDIEPAVQRLMRQTGYSSQQIAKIPNKDAGRSSRCQPDKNGKTAAPVFSLYCWERERAIRDRRRKVRRASRCEKDGYAGCN